MNRCVVHDKKVTIALRYWIIDNIDHGTTRQPMSGCRSICNLMATKILPTPTRATTLYIYHYENVEEPNVLQHGGYTTFNAVRM